MQFPFRIQIKGYKELPDDFAEINFNCPLLPHPQIRYTDRSFFKLADKLEILLEVPKDDGANQKQRKKITERLVYQINHTIQYQYNFDLKISFEYKKFKEKHASIRHSILPHITPHNNNINNNNNSKKKNKNDETSYLQSFSKFIGEFDDSLGSQEVESFKELRSLWNKEIIPKGVDDQTYILTINSNEIFIMGTTDTALYYGLTTLSQIMEENQGHWVVQSQFIFDYPVFSLRGITDQQCHGQVGNLKSIKRHIRFLSRYKNNVVGYNLEDVMGFNDYPEIGKARGAFTTEEISEICRYAKRYFMEVIPGFQGLGHLENFLYHQEFRNVAEFPGANCLDLSKTETYDVLEKLYGEICEKFDTPFVNVCLDESYDFGKFKSKNWIKDQGGKAEVFKNHILWLYDLLHERYGKEMLIYHDSLVKWGKDRIGDFPKGDEGLKVIYWDYNKKPFYRRLKYLVKRGFFVIASPSITNWSRPFPNIEHALGNIKKLATYAAKHGAHGFLNSSWGDFCNENLRTLDLLGFGIGSYFAWNPADFNEDHFSRAFFSDFLGMFNGHLMWDTLLELNFINRGGPWSTPFFDRLWEHPLPPHEPVYPRKAARNDIAQVDIAEEMLLRSERTIVRNNDIVDYLKYCVNIVRYNAQKALLSHKMYSVWKDTNKIPVKYRKSMVELKKRNNLLWQQYEKLWLHAAKKEGLERVQRKKESVDRIYQDLISLMEHSHIDEHSRMDETKSKKNPPPRTVTKIHYHNQYLQSEWIVHPDFRGWKDVANEFDLAFPFMFKKTFRIPPKSSDMLGIQYAKLQTIAHTYLRVKINGQHVGECISRFFLSPVIFDNSVQIFDVKEYLQEGENTLEVEAWEFSGSITTINILLEVGWKNDTIKEQDEYSKRNPIKIRSNSDWLVSAPKMDYAPKMESAPILEYRFTYNNFKVAQSLGKPLEVNGNIWAPDLKNNIPARISHHFGEFEYKIALVNMTVKSSFLRKIARKILFFLL